MERVSCHALAGRIVIMGGLSLKRVLRRAQTMWTFAASHCS